METLCTLKKRNIKKRKSGICRTLFFCLNLQTWGHFGENWSNGKLVTKTTLTCNCMGNISMGAHFCDLILTSRSRKTTTFHPRLARSPHEALPSEACVSLAEQSLIKFVNPHSEDLSVDTPKFDGIGEPSSSALRHSFYPPHIHIMISDRRM